MNGNAFDIARELDAAQVGARYGMTIRNGKEAICPAHNDRHPSLTFKGNRFKCWACGVSGSSIDLTMMLLGLSSPLDAVRRLNDDFNLGIELDRPPTTEEQEQAQRRRELMETDHQYTEWRDKMLKRLCDAYRAGHIALQSGRELTDREALAVFWMAAIEYWANTLDYGTMAEQMTVFRQREELEKLCDKILRNTPTRSETD